METYRYEGDGVDAVGAHCVGAGSVQSRSAADAPREKVSTGVSETWEKRGYLGQRLGSVSNALGTPREIRSRENDECVGGLRNPIAGWPVRLPLRRWVFPQTLLEPGVEQQRPREIDRVHAIELHGCEPFSSQFVYSARHRLKAALQVKDGPTPRAHGYDADLIEALLRQSGDLETALPGWLREGFPLGIETVIENCGIFPATAADTAAVEASRIYGRNGFPSLRHKNYLSFYESVDLAQADLDRSVGLGFVEKFGSLEESKRSSAKTCGSRALRAW